LWGWGYDTKKIAWVNWKIVYKNKENVALGIMDIENFNKDLLGKWKWRLGV